MYPSLGASHVSPSRFSPRVRATSWWRCHSQGSSLLPSCSRTRASALRSPSSKMSAGTYRPPSMPPACEWRRPTSDQSSKIVAVAVLLQDEGQRLEITVLEDVCGHVQAAVHAARMRMAQADIRPVEHCRVSLPVEWNRNRSGAEIFLAKTAMAPVPDCLEFLRRPQGNPDGAVELALADLRHFEPFLIHHGSLARSEEHT